MSKVVVIFEQAGMSHNDYDAICHELMAQGSLYNANRLAHVAFERDNKFCVIDVWNSEEALKEFADKSLMPAFLKAGITPQRPLVVPAHNWVGIAEELTSA